MEYFLTLAGKVPGLSCSPKRATATSQRDVHEKKLMGDSDDTHCCKWRWGTSSGHHQSHFQLYRAQSLAKIVFVGYNSHSSWIRTVMELSPAQSACPCRSGTTTHSCSWLLPYSHLPLTGMLQEVAQALLHGVSAEPSAQLRSCPLVYIDAVSHWHVVAIGTLEGMQFPFYTNNRDLFWECTFNFKLEQSKEEVHSCCLRVVHMLRCFTTSGPQCRQDQ